MEGRLVGSDVGLAVEGALVGFVCIMNRIKANVSYNLDISCEHKITHNKHTSGVGLAVEGAFVDGAGVTGACVGFFEGEGVTGAEVFGASVGLIVGLKVG